MLPGQEEEDPRGWSVEDVGEWLSALALGQYREAFADAAVDGAFLMDLNDDLRNTLGIDHNLHRKDSKLCAPSPGRCAAAAIASGGLQAQMQAPMQPMQLALWLLLLEDCWVLFHQLPSSQVDMVPQ